MEFKKIFIVVVLFVFCYSARAVQENTDSLLQVLNATDIPSHRITILNKLAKIYVETDPILSASYADRALFKAESIEDEFGQAEAHYNLGVLAYNDKRYNESMVHFLKAEDGFNILHDDKWLAHVYLYLSRDHKQKLEYEKALRLLFKAMETFKKLDSKKKLAETYNAIGGNFYDQGDYERAFEYYTNSLELYKELGDVMGMGSLYNNLAELYRFKKDYNTAISYYLRSQLIYMEFNHTAKLAVIYTNLGKTYLELNMLDSSEYYLDSGLQLSQLTGNPVRISSASIARGKLYQKQGDWEQAKEKLMIGYTHAAESSNLANLIDASEALSELYLEKKDFARAYQYFIQYRHHDDSLHRESNLEKITQLEMKLLYDLENEVQEAQIQRTNLKYFTIAVVLLSLIIIVVLLYGRQQIKIQQVKTLAEHLQMERDQLQDEIDYKNRELATNVMYLVKKNELINYISEKLLKAKINFKPAIRNTVDTILLELQSNADENIWSVFEDRFREVHKNFYENLEARFPNLSENDRKLCAFIRLDMNTKEIATITHQNINSIEVARTRLRKKLNIANKEINLNSFLASI